MNCNLAQKVAVVLGRICIALLFFQSGWHKIGGGFEPNLAVMVKKGLPVPEVLLTLTIIMVFAGGLMTQLTFQFEMFPFQLKRALLVGVAGKQ